MTPRDLAWSVIPWLGALVIGLALASSPNLDDLDAARATALDAGDAIVAARVAAKGERE